MFYIYIIINPKFNNYSLVKVGNEAPEKITSELNTKYANLKIENDFYRLIYSKEINGDQSTYAAGIKDKLVKYEVTNSQFYNIKGISALEILDNLLEVKKISDEELYNWWDSINIGWKYTLMQKIRPSSGRKEVEAHLDKTSIENLREILLIESLNLWRKEITTLEPLRLLKNLKKLDFQFENEIKYFDLNPLSELFKLEELNIVDTDIETLQPVSSLLNLKKLICFRTKITSISPIFHLTDLETLWVGGRVPMNERELMRKINPNCKINKQ